MNFSENLIILRRKKGLTQLDLATALGLEKSIISKYERSNNYPTFENLCAIADILGASTDQLLGRAPLPDTNERKEGKSVKRDTVERLEECLLAFVERVAKGGATTETEVQVLPAVAQVLANLRLG